MLGAFYRNTTNYVPANVPKQATTQALAAMSGYAIANPTYGTGLSAEACKLFSLLFGDCQICVIVVNIQS